MFDIITNQNAHIAYKCIDEALSNTIVNLEEERATLRGHAKGMVTKQINNCLTAQIISEKAQAKHSEEALEWATMQAEKALGYEGCFLRQTICEAITASEQAQQVEDNKGFTMTLEQIKQAVTAGNVVYWMNDGYTVEVDSAGQWFIVCTFNGSAVGLTWLDGVTLNGKPEQFYIKRQTRKTH